MCESLSQKWERIINKVELVWGNALAAVCCYGQGIPLGIDAEELQVEEAGSEPALRAKTYYIRVLESQSR